MESTQHTEKRWTSDEEGPSHPLEARQGCGCLALSLAWSVSQFWPPVAPQGLVLGFCGSLVCPGSSQSRVRAPRCISG